MYCKCGNFLKILNDDEYETTVTQCKRCINQNRTKRYNEGFEDGFKRGKEAGYKEGYSDCITDTEYFKKFL